MSAEDQLNQYAAQQDTVLTIGTFDGVHIGHQAILGQLRVECELTGLMPTVVTFRNHPRSVLTPGENTDQIISLDDRLLLLKKNGVRHIVVLDFTLEFSKLRAREFIVYLIRHLRMRSLVIGPDFTLGFKREGDVTKLEELSKELGFSLRIVDPKILGELSVRSRILRQMILTGDVKTARDMMGRPFVLKGIVGVGDRRGRGLGFPTANLQPEQGLVIPGNGIYAARTKISGKLLPTVVSVGVRPTFGEGYRTIEAYIMDFDENIYDVWIELEFVDFIREEIKFDSVEGLIKQMHHDVESSRLILDRN